MLSLIKSFLVIALVFSTLSLSAEARGGGGGGGEGWLMDPAFMYLYGNTTDNGNTTTTSRLLADLSFGYKFNSPIFLGALYSYDSTSTTTSSSSSTDTYGSYGPSI